MPSNNNTYFECREELLLELQEERAQLPHYTEEDDVVTRLLEAPLEEPEWIVVVGVHDRRMLTTAQVSAGLRCGELTAQTLVWRGGMRAWAPIASIPELNRAAPDRSAPDRAARAEAPQLPPQPSRAVINPAAPRVIIAAFESDARELPPDAAPSTRVKRAVMGLSALIMFGVFLTMFAISSARDNTEQRARARAAAAATPTAQATDPSSSTSPPEDLRPTAAALLSEAERDDTAAAPVQRAAARRPDTRERY